MSKSLYQYRFNPEYRQQIEVMLPQLLASHKYKPSKTPNVFTLGSGWFTAKRRVEYRITGDLLSICIWKVVAPILPMIEMGCNDANSAYGAALNGGMKTTIEHTANMISQQFPMTNLAFCMPVPDNYLDTLMQYN